MKVLFLGNSHTYYHQMPLMVEALSESSDGPTIETEESTGGGVDFQWHWNQRRSRSLVERGGWDFIVLQNRSGGPLEESDSMKRYAGLLVDEIRKVDAQPVFYMTWAALSRPDTQEEITSVYRQIADEHSALLAPVGEAWKNVLESGAGIRLHDADGRHAAPAGSYLAACVLTSMMTDTEPLGWPGKLQRDGQSLIALDDAQVSSLHRAASEAIADERGR